jgi:DNA repair photolyase
MEAMTTPREFVEIQVKSVLNKVAGMPFRWSINPYRGCSHGCVFCYARRTHWFLDEDGINQWSSRIFVKVNAPDVLRHELARRTWKREEVAVGTATDPYQAAEGKYRLTRRILEAFYQFRTPASIVTRSPLVLRDLDLLTGLARRAGVTVCVSIATADPEIAREIEPTVAPPAQRFRAVEALASRGIRTGVLLAPIVPGLTDHSAHLEAVVQAARDHGAHFVAHNVLHLGEVTRDAFLQYLAQSHPDLLSRYARMYAGKYAPRDYRAGVSKVVAAHKARFRIADSRYLEPPGEPEQLSLLAPRESTDAPAPREGEAPAGGRPVPVSNVEACRSSPSLSS